ncbi:modulator of macroautophagy TMEM150B isoform X3 [Xiphias gladius]|uniref:modulator of macroautophagy TMEM150B isoform X3 n=1 Tax=Xiphias gladius TaxID=8245 RepID=UPI001A99191B|nr:modulator of macroautophagy TMEM150B isoform X3 [Xiphias gladius]
MLILHFYLTYFLFCEGEVAFHFERFSSYEPKQQPFCNMWQWALLPICLAVFGTVGIWTVFAVAVTNGSVNLTEGVPYISKCGTYNPQSCLFSQVCNICSVLALWIVVIRFQQVKDYGNHGRANTASIVLGFISSVGISVIGNFQDRCWVASARATCCILCTILVIVMSVLHNRGYPSGAAVCEWALVMLFFCLFGLFAAEFRHIDCHHLTVQTQALRNDCSPASTEMNGYAANALS